MNLAPACTKTPFRDRRLKYFHPVSAYAPRYLRSHMAHSKSWCLSKILLVQFCEKFNVDASTVRTKTFHYIIRASYHNVLRSTFYRLPWSLMRGMEEAALRCALQNARAERQGGRQRWRQNDAAQRVRINTAAVAAAAASAVFCRSIGTTRRSFRSLH